MMSKAVQLSVCLWVLLVVCCWAQEDSDAERPILPVRPILPWCGAYWGSWSAWSACNVRCGKGTQTRRRECIRRLDNCRARPGPDVRIPVPRNCTGPSSQTRTCVKPPCCPPINGDWSKWGCWGECRNGIRQRHRVCNNPIPQGWGTYCSGKPTQTDDCCAIYQDLIFSLDASGSIGQTNFNEMVNHVHSVIGLMDLDTGNGPPDTVRVGIQLFNHGQTVINHLDDLVGLLPYTYPGGGTNIPAAITHANNVMFTTPHERPSPLNPNTLVLITDGWSSTTQTLSTNNIDRIIVIGVGNFINSVALQQYATSQDDFYHATNFCAMRNWLMQRLNCSHRFVIRPFGLQCLEITSTMAKGRETDNSNF